jgi:hypothetical protein
MGGTHQAILTDVDNWLRDFGKLNILWISGSPGAGKTALVSTIVSRVSSGYCARFFFQRNTAALRDPRLVWRAIALDSALDNSAMAKTILQTFDWKDKTKAKPMQPEDLTVLEQFKSLIENPLPDIFQHPSTQSCVVIIDALDECDSANERQQDWLDLLVTLQSWSRLPKTFKLIITSRNHSDIQQSLSSVSQHIQLATGDDVSLDSETFRDLSWFFSESFKGIVARRSQSLEPDWPGSAKIMELTKYAAGLFIWADTALQFIGQKGDPMHRLALISSDPAVGGDRVDKLYLNVLDTVFQSLTAIEHESFTAAIATIVLAKDPLSSVDLQDLLQLPQTLLQSLTDEMSSIISTSQPDGLLHLCHKSFSDFLLDSKRAKSFAINYTAESAKIAQHCLELMNKQLRFNMCNLKTSHCLYRDLADSEQHCMEAVISTSLRHSSCHWAEYLPDSSDKHSNQHTILIELKHFLHNHLLHWLEVLSLIKLVHIAPQFLLIAAKWVRVSKQGYIMLLTFLTLSARFWTIDCQILQLMEVDL